MLESKMIANFWQFKIDISERWYFSCLQWVSSFIGSFKVRSSGKFPGIKFPYPLIEKKENANKNTFQTSHCHINNWQYRINVSFVWNLNVTKSFHKPQAYQKFSCYSHNVHVALIRSQSLICFSLCLVYLQKCWN